MLWRGRRVAGREAAECGATGKVQLGVGQPRASQPHGWAGHGQLKWDRAARGGRREVTGTERKAWGSRRRVEGTERLAQGGLRGRLA